MKQDELYNHPGWADCTFEGARRQVLRLGLKTTFREKLQWLEEAGRLAKKFRSARARHASHNKTKGKNLKAKIQKH